MRRGTETQIISKVMPAELQSVKTAQSVCLQPLACWDCGFESRLGHGCLSVVSVVCLSGRGLCDGLITRLEESYRLCRVIVSDLETSRMKRLKHASGL
jgi:hypothetical protein